MVGVEVACCANTAEVPLNNRAANRLDKTKGARVFGRMAALDIHTLSANII